MSELLPDGIDKFRDAPHNFTSAVKAALMFLSFEEFSNEDRPPREIWTDGELLNEWFDDVRRRQKERADGRDLGDDQVRNDAARQLIRDD